MRKYKLTDQNMQTYGGCQCELGVEKTTDGSGELCSPGWLHCYADPILAILLNPIHADIAYPRLFVAETRGRGKHDNGLKSGYTSMKLVKEIPVPEISLIQRIAFGILCAKEVYKDDTWNAWADTWLDGTNRTAANAANAANAAYAATYAAHAAHAAYATYAAAYAAAYAAYATYATYATYAAHAAHAAAHSGKSINLVAIVYKAMEYT